MTPAATNSPALLLEGVRAGYGQQSVLRDVHARLDEGQAAALLGPNGSGKSTLLKVVLGLLPPSAGRVEVFGQSPEALNRRRRQIGYMPQVRDVDRAFPITVFDVAMMGRIGRLGLFRRPSAHDRELVREVLSRVGLLERASRPFGTLSGGQQQRAFLARALAQEPDLLVLDEPVAGVDDENRDRIGALLVELRARGVPMLIATHDVEELHPLVFDQHWSMRQGQLLVDGAEPAHTHDVDRHEDASRASVSSRPVGLRSLDRRRSG